MRVAEFRNDLDGAFRCFNVDYHACVNPQERAAWVNSARFWAGEVEKGLAACSRATAEDKRRAGEVVRMLKDRIAKVEGTTYPLT